jgi:hypothetical protein
MMWIFVIILRTDNLWWISMYDLSCQSEWFKKQGLFNRSIIEKINDIDLDSGLFLSNWKWCIGAKSHNEVMKRQMWSELTVMMWSEVKLCQVIWSEVKWICEDYRNVLNLSEVVLCDVNSLSNSIVSIQFDLTYHSQKVENFNFTLISAVRGLYRIKSLISDLWVWKWELSERQNHVQNIWYSLTVSQNIITHSINNHLLRKFFIKFHFIPFHFLTHTDQNTHFLSRTVKWLCPLW